MINQYLIGIYKENIKEEFADITDFAKELGTTTENLLMYLLAKQFNGINSPILYDINTSIEKLTETINNNINE